ncbi:MAG: hypothetical protein WCV72_00840 [Patescibacteria group bacterium]
MTNEKENTRKKKCFLITPIGEIGSIVRRRVDQFKEYIYEPALEGQYEIIRSDQISTPGKITTQVVDHILYDDLAIIDLTGFNPNVMYEMAIRHIARKPTINIFNQEERLPFDVHNFRSIPYDCTNLKMADCLVEEIKKAVREISTKDYQAPQIIKHKLDLDTILKDPEEFVMLLKKHLPISNSETTSLYSSAASTTPVVYLENPGEFSELFINPSFHRCSVCGYGFKMKNNPNTELFAFDTRSVACPKCGNIDKF